MERNHDEEDDVKEAMKFDKKSKERSDVWMKLRRRGDFVASINSLQDGKELLYMVRTSEKSDPLDALPCEFCKGFFAPNKVKIHQNKCFLRHGNINPSTRGSRILKTTSIIQGKHKEIFETVLSRMKQDEVFKVIKSDEYLLMLGALELHKKEKERYKDIAYNLRIIGKVLLNFIKHSQKGEWSSKDLVNPANYDLLIEVMFDMAGYRGPRDI